MLRKRKGDQTKRLTMIDLQTTRIQYLWLNSLHFLLHQTKVTTLSLIKELPTNNDNNLWTVALWPFLVSTFIYGKQYYDHEPCRTIFLSFFFLFYYLHARKFFVFAQTWSDRWDIFMEVLSFLARSNDGTYSLLGKCDNVGKWWRVREIKKGKSK